MLAGTLPLKDDFLAVFEIFSSSLDARPSLVVPAGKGKISHHGLRIATRDL